MATKKTHTQSLVKHSPKAIIKPITVLVLAFMLLITPAFASQDDYSLTWQSHWNKFIDRASSLTTYGEQNGYATQWDKRHYFDNDGTMKVSLTCSEHSLVNMYYVKPEGTLSYVGEKYSGDTHTFLGLTQYSEFMYECYPKNVQGSKYTSDGFKHGDKVCKNGDSVAVVYFNDPQDSSKGVSYEELWECSSGTSCERDLDNCVKAGTDRKTSTHRGGFESDQFKEDITQTSDETIDMYREVLDDLEGEIVDLDQFNELTDHEKLVAVAKVEAVEEIIQETKKDVANADKSGFPWTLGAVLIALIAALNRKKIAEALK